MLVSGTDDGEIFLWSTDTYDVTYTIKGIKIQHYKNKTYESHFFLFQCFFSCFHFSQGHAGRINAIKFDCESKNIISCSNDMALNVFDIQTSTRIYSATLEHEPTALSWNGTILFIGDTRGNLSLWDSQGALFLSTLHCHEGDFYFISFPTNNQ